MAKTSSNLDTPLRDAVQRLADFEPQDVPVVSLYLNLAPDQHGRDNYETFCRKGFAEQLKAFPEHSAEHASLERDIERIETYLANELNRSANGLALFTSSGAGEFFEAIQLDAPLDAHWLFIGAVPHIYPLVRLIDQYPRYALVQLDTNHARIFVFGLGSVHKREQVTNVKTRRTSMGGWSQARYQRHVDKFHQQHVKEVAEMLDRVVREDKIQHVVIAGDDIVSASLRDALPQHVRERLVDTLNLGMQAGESELSQATLDALRQQDAETDRERVTQVIEAWQSGGLGVVGPESTMRALQMGQVDELLIASSPQDVKPIQNLPADAAPEPIAVATSAPGGPDEKHVHVSDEFVTRAHQTSARVRIIEDPELLRPHGGVAAALRFRT